MWHPYPGHSCAGALILGVTDDCYGSGRDRSVNELISVAGLAAHSDERIARLYSPRIIFQSADARITALSEDFRAVQKLKKIHGGSIVSLLQIGACDRRARYQPTARTRRPGLRFSGRTSLSHVIQLRHAILLQGSDPEPGRCPLRPGPDCYPGQAQSRPARSCRRMTAPRFHPAPRPAQQYRWMGGDRSRPTMRAANSLPLVIGLSLL